MLLTKFFESILRLCTSYTVWQVVPVFYCIIVKRFGSKRINWMCVIITLIIRSSPVQVDITTFSKIVVQITGSYIVKMLVYMINSQLFTSIFNIKKSKIHTICNTKRCSTMVVINNTNNFVRCSNTIV